MRAKNNLTRNAHKLCKAAKVKPWPKFFQAMRTTRENDLKLMGVAEVTYCKWQGHAPEVSRKHYVEPTDEEFAVVTGKRSAA